MSSSLLQSKQSDSILSEPLADYTRLESSPINQHEQQQDQQQPAYLHFHIEENTNNKYFGDTVFSDHSYKLQKLKRDFHSQRNQFIQDHNLQKFNRQVIKTFLINKQLQRQFDQGQIEKNRLQTQMLFKQQELKTKQLEYNRIQQQAKTKKQLADFQSKLKQKFRSKNNIQEDEQNKTNQEMFNVLQDSLLKKSQQIHDKLRPYLQYGLAEKNQHNQIIVENNNYLKQQKQKYLKSFKTSNVNNNLFNQKRNQLELQDQNEDQIELARHIERIQQQNKKDAQIQKKKQFIWL